MSAALLLDRLHGVRKCGDGRWVARCPAHEDSRPSLSIRELPDGRVLLHDFAGCSTRAVLAMLDLEMQALFPERLADAGPVRDRTHWHALREAIFALRDEARVIVFVTSDIAAGATISNVDADRVAQAAGRIAQAVEVLYGR